MAFSIVRITNITAFSISVLFNEDVDTSVGISNVSLTSSIESVPNPKILSINIENDIIILSFTPIFENVNYSLTFFSTPTVLFRSIGGEVILEDGHRNSIFIVSPGDNSNTIRDDMLNNLPEEVYKTDSPSMIKDILTGLSYQLQGISDSIGVTKAGNYLSISVIDEQLTRGNGPIDKLANQGAFEISRVALTTTGFTNIGEIEFDANRVQSFSTRSGIYINPVISSLPPGPISLQSIDVINEIVTDNISLGNHFSGLDISVSNINVMQVISVALLRDEIYYEYNITKFGYTLLNNRYDSLLAGINVNFTSNEILLSSDCIDFGFPAPQPGDQFIISYVYKNLGRNIDESSVQLSTIVSVTREIAPPITNRFSTNFAPIVNNLDQIFKYGGIQFLATQSTESIQAFVSPHPAFITEIPFSITRLPSAPGNYSVNYQNGEVDVFGADSYGNGTGSAPPDLIYIYRKVFVNNLDYVYDSTTDELAINSLRNISGISAKISFQYEDVFADGVDFESLSHIESLNERVGNRLLSDFVVQAQHYPITDVFQVFNETTGEIYNITTFNDSSITFSGRSAPKQNNINREKASFTLVSNETLFVANNTTNAYSQTIFVINLANKGISDKQGSFIGANFDTSVYFSDTTIFSDEYFYEDMLPISNLLFNLNKLQSIGDYTIDYVNGIVYVAVSPSQSIDIGNISYKYKNISTRNSHLISVNNIYRSVSQILPNVENYSYSDFSDAGINIETLEEVGQRFINNDVLTPLIVGLYQNGPDGIASANSNIFVSNSANFSTSDVRNILKVDDDPIPYTIIQYINQHQILVSPNFLSAYSNVGWYLYSTSDLSKTLKLDNTIVSVKGIYKLLDLYGPSAVSSSELTNYYNINKDIISGNIIELDAYNTLINGDAVLVDYAFGDLFVDYLYLSDEILISYEYGNNSINWSISNSIVPGTPYYVSYKYGALREQLVSNFGSLTQVPQLSTLSSSLSRETFRSIVGGTLQSFITGPTIPSIETLVESFTEVKPEIKENTVGWVLGESNLNLEPIVYSEPKIFGFGKFGQGLSISNGQNVEVPAISHVKVDEGTIETWIRPSWSGLENDSSLTFNLTMDGYSNTSNVFIGFSGKHPETMPFTLQFNSDDAVFLSQPSDMVSSGFYIWFDNIKKIWKVQWKQNIQETHDFSGTIKSSGRFFNITYPAISDGYILYQTVVFTNQLSVPFSHDFYVYPVIQAFDNNGSEIIPYSIKNTNKADAVVSFIIPTSGTIVATAPDIVTTFNNQLSVNVVHNFGFYPVVQVLNSSNEVFIPLSIVDNSINDFTVTFASPTSGTILSIDSPSNRVTASFTNQTSVHLVHNIGLFPLIQVIDDLGYVLTPLSVINNSVNDVTINFSTITSGTIIATASTGGLITNIVTSVTDVITFTSLVHGFNTQDVPSVNSLSFISGDDHYIFDMAKSSDSNRMSLYKDGTGYLNFRVFGNNCEESINTYILSTNINDWTSEQLHQVATSWKFNSFEEKDEMHLFVDGFEVPNLFKFGGKPDITSGALYGEVAEEILIPSAPKPIIGGFDGITTAGSNIFTSNGSYFLDGGIKFRDSLYILDATQDGTGIPNNGNPYTVIGVGETTILVTSSLLGWSGFLNSIDNIHFSVNQTQVTTATPVDIQRFIIKTKGVSGSENELDGISSIAPDYSIANGSNYEYIISINNGVSKYDSVFLETLGLKFSRIIEKEFVYGGNDGYIRTNSRPPTSLDDVKITEIIFDGYEISIDDGFDLIDGYLTGYLAGFSQPSNNVNGRRLQIDLSGENIDYLHNPAIVTITGTTYSGSTSEEIVMLQDGSYVTNEYWKTISSILVAVPPTDISLPAGAIDIREYLSITVSENNGDYAQISDFTNGLFALIIFGSGGLPFKLNEAWYELDYTSYLNIGFDSFSGKFVIGSDFNGDNTVNAVLDEFRILDYMSADTRIGETLGNYSRSITTDYIQNFEFAPDNNTLLLMHFDGDGYDSSNFIDRFDAGYEVAPSVNSDFDTGIKLVNRPFVIDNAGNVFNNDAGTIEFWISPKTEWPDGEKRYFIDMLSVIQDSVTSITEIVVVSNQNIRSVESVRLATDVYNIGTNYFTGGSVSNIDNKTITLGIPLPSQNTAVKITYIPMSYKGDRVSIFLDENGFVNFYMKANNAEYLLSSQIKWKRDTWHRIMVMWTTNNGNNLDRIRMFIDGLEGGTIKYGTGLLYGKGIIWGQAEIHGGVNRFISSNISLTDTFAQIYIGTDVFNANVANAVIDNLRFSDIQRLQSIRSSVGGNIDVNYQPNTNFAIPVIGDIDTTAIYNFDTFPEQIINLATLSNASTGIFRFEVGVIDSLLKVIGNTNLENLLISLINTIKPANSIAIVKFSK